MRSWSCAVRQFLPEVLSKFAIEARQGVRGEAPQCFTLGELSVAQVGQARLGA